MIEAYDSAYPDNKGVTQSSINVRRNLHAPVFNPADYVTTIYDEYLSVGSPINVTVSARDEDDPVSVLHTYPPSPKVRFRLFFIM